jgi:hypothetical protein
LEQSGWSAFESKTTLKLFYQTQKPKVWLRMGWKVLKPLESTIEFSPLVVFLMARVG